MATLLPSIRETYFGVKALLQTVAEDNAELTSLQARLNADPGIPVSNPTTSFWLKNTPFLDLVDKRSKTLPKYADIVIIGSGITGTSVARTILSECASMGINRRVVMLEARQTCSGATGRNGGHIKCTPHESFCEYKDRFGVERARALVDFQTSHLPILVDLAKQESWDLAEARQVETLDVFYDEEVWLDNKRKVEEFRKGMPEGTRDTFVWEKGEAHEKYNLGGHAYGAITYQAGAIWPCRLVTCALDSLLRTYPSDFTLETHTSVENISTTRNPNQPFIVHTSRGDILACHIIHATNAHTARLVPGLRGKLFPVRGTMTAQRPGKSFPKLDGSRSWCLINKKGYEYVTQRPGQVDSIDGLGGEIMIGGGMIQSGRKGFGEFGVASDAETNYLTGCHLGGVLPMGFGLENWGEDAPGGRMKNMWSGSLGLTADMMPFVGRLEPSLTGRTPVKANLSKDAVGPVTLPAEWISAGYNGEGMVNAWLCGVALGLMVLGREDISAAKTSGRPHGKLDEWFPKEYICSQARVTNASVYELLETR
ncbi:DAO-domain-containing protein [Hyaloscypha bicolor E]|uniref:DAO-domain-containing protein n=1 Tax=Hyaloscypha bicolor E TaxID=1095630 RepID=A0A2J6TMC9_9HELO|nr:DAO-domain-containing protein [Hyaloscypha bicolor E]PMD64148.1 DAO-domain-containing protein [Hyaloscypha bicolor E]